MPKETRQRADLTYKHNLQRGRHGWLRLTPAYSEKIVRQLLEPLPPDSRVLDPFSGSGTTPLCAAQLGMAGVAVEINPFLVWFGNTKAGDYTEGSVVRFRERAAHVHRTVSSRAVEPAAPPPLKNIERWWPPDALDCLCRLRAAIDFEDAPPAVTDLLQVAFCRTLIALSNAAFDHQSMSFKAPDARHEEQGLARFAAEVEGVGDTVAPNPTGQARILLGDARDLSALGAPPVEGFDVLVTSPPYPNRISYIRELRPYMYWLSYLFEAREAGELDWRAIGGTWGVATSRLQSWVPDGRYPVPGYLLPILDAIAASHPRNGPLMAHYIHKYFEDIIRHLRAVRGHLRPGADVHYIVGNSSFYGHLVPVERIYRDLLEEAGFEGADWRVIRKRNSKKELYEFDVTARRPG